MHLPISPPEPTQTVPLVQPFKLIFHLTIGQMLRTHEIVEHLARVDERQDRSDCGRFAREERVPATKVDEGGREDDEDRDGHGQDDGGEEGDARFVLI